MADLESGTKGYAFASGLAAIATLLEALDAGDHIIASEDLYGGSFRLFDKVRTRSAGLRVQLRRPGGRRGHRGGDRAQHPDGLGGDARPTRCCGWPTWRPSPRSASSAA